MKNTSKYLIAVICVCALVATFTQSKLLASSKSPEKVSFEETEGWKKIDLRLREAWLDATKKGDKKRKLECIAKTKKRVSADDKAILKNAGFTHRTVIGRIVTGSLNVKDLPDVANLELIEAMELATPMTLKKK